MATDRRSGSGERRLSQREKGEGSAPRARDPAAQPPRRVGSPPPRIHHRHRGRRRLRRGGGARPLGGDHRPRPHRRRRHAHRRRRCARRRAALPDPPGAVTNLVFLVAPGTAPAVPGKGPACADRGGERRGARHAREAAYAPPRPLRLPPPAAGRAADVECQRAVEGRGSRSDSRLTTPDGGAGAGARRAREIFLAGGGRSDRADRKVASPTFHRARLVVGHGRYNQRGAIVHPAGHVDGNLSSWEAREAEGVTGSMKIYPTGR